MNLRLAAIVAGYWASLMTPYMVGSDIAENDKETLEAAAETLAGGLKRRILEGNVLKIGVLASEGRYTAFLYEEAEATFPIGTTLLMERFGTFLREVDRRSTKVIEATEEIFVLFGNNCTDLLEPRLDEMASGNTIEELVAAINRGTPDGVRPWLVIRSGAFWESLVGGDPEEARFKAFYNVDPAEFWHGRNVTQNGLEAMRPGGILWRDGTAESLGRFEWILLGRLS